VKHHDFGPTVDRQQGRKTKLAYVDVSSRKNSLWPGTVQQPSSCIQMRAVISANKVSRTQVKANMKEIEDGG
jgi:hypothetical protein